MPLSNCRGGEGAAINSGGLPAGDLFIPLSLIPARASLRGGARIRGDPGWWHRGDSRVASACGARGCGFSAVTPPRVTGAPRQLPPRPGAGQGHQVRQTSGCPPRPSPKIRRVVPVPAVAAKSWPYVPGREQLAVPAGAPGPRCPLAGEGRAGGGTAAAPPRAGQGGSLCFGGAQNRLRGSRTRPRGSAKSSGRAQPCHRGTPGGDKAAAPGSPCASPTRSAQPKDKAAPPGCPRRAAADLRSGPPAGDTAVPAAPGTSTKPSGGGPHPEEGVPPSAGSPAADQGHREGREGREGPHVSPRSPPRRLRPARRSRKGHAVPEPARSPRFPPGSAAAPGTAGSGGCGTCHSGRTSPLSPHPIPGNATRGVPAAATPGVSPPAAATPGVFPRRCHPRAGSLATALCYGERRGAPEGCGRCQLSARRSNTGDSGSVRGDRGLPRPTPPRPPRQGSDLEAAALASVLIVTAGGFSRVPPAPTPPPSSPQRRGLSRPRTPRSLGTPGNPRGTPPWCPLPLANPPGHPPAAAPGASRERGNPPEPGDSRDSRGPQASPAPVAAPGAEGRWGSPPSRTPHKFTHLPPTPGLRCPRALPPLTMARWRRHVRRRARDPSGSRWHNQGPGASLDSGFAVPPSPSRPRRASVSPARRRRPRGLRAAMRRRYDAAPHAQPRAPASPPLGASRGLPVLPGGSGPPPRINPAPNGVPSPRSAAAAGPGAIAHPLLSPHTGDIGAAPGWGFVPPAKVSVSTSGVLAPLPVLCHTTGI
ncbi:basic proline-rich protein-like [Zonotrichia leucophrys gambelii]|uniref:basic proline-rich protein-like n=1 Tax=Zonotrichia leucophrys gambelii TaxID=257770 RepID=UPI00314079ED